MEARNEASTAKTKTTNGLREANQVMAAKLFFHILETNLNGHFTKIHSISKFNLSFSGTKLKKLCFIVTLPHNTICYLSFRLASKFNTEIYKNSSTSNSVVRSLLGFVPGPSGTSVLQTYDTAP